MKYIIFFIFKKVRKVLLKNPYCNPLKGKLIEYIKTYEVMILKEFGKITQYLRNMEYLCKNYIFI